MMVFQSVADVPDDFGPSAVTIGKFDGVHLGHRTVIDQVRRTAAERGLVSTALTFDRNPLAVLRPAIAPVSLTSNAQKLELLAASGLEATLMVQFTKEFSEESPERFGTEILAGALNARVVYVGDSFRFGKQAKGTVEDLRRMGQDLGFEVRSIDKVSIGGMAVSSTRIRSAISAGAVKQAGRLLGRAPTVRGVVVHGQHRGRELGYPTANLAPDFEGFVPADGVYAGTVTVAGTAYPAAISVGNNPTFVGVPEKQVEAHLLDQAIDLYGQTVEVAFLDFVRPMVKFAGMEELAVQMIADEAKIRQVLSGLVRP
ncbi:MAG: Riboflavin biosynthesis protein [Microbacteriaceae bacterium]|nr:Riboflavin biosynthesis protein [Microbacteriaceae bacterium]